MPVQYRVVQRLLGYLLTFFSLGMLPPLALSLILGDGEAFSFLYAFFLLFLLGTALWVQAAHRAPRRQPLRLRDGFVVVSLFWIGLGMAGSIPLYISPSLQLSGTDAVFEAVSGLTTTGATVLTGLDDMSPSILFYRQFLQWVGGLGIIVLAVAILPLVGMGGVQLYQAEAPHSLTERRLTPRITETAKVLWYLYFALTAACGLAYWLAGMSPLDAAGHAFSTIAIGGFSTHDANFGYFDSALIEMIAIVFMILAGANFGLHYLALSRRSLQPYRQNGEFRGYVTVLASVGVICIGYLWVTSFYGDSVETLRHGLFQTVSIATTTGYTTTGYDHWPVFASTLLLLASFIGGCAGSTGGGMKVIRFLLMVKHGGKELYRIIHPTAQVTVRVGDRVISQSALQSVWGFFAAYITTFTVLFLLLTMTGLDQVSAFSAVAATLNNLGPGLGEVSQSYTSVSDFGKWLLCASMVFGRLEVFTLLVVLTRASGAASEFAGTLGFRYREAAHEPQACAVLQQHPSHLPQQGLALDLACGRGGNALWLACRGLTVHAWDYSEAGIRHLRADAERHRLAIQAEVRDVVLKPPEPDQYDLLVVSHFLDRSLMPALLAAVRPGGLLYYQTFLVGHPGPGPRNPDFLLRPGELPEYCADWEILHSLEQDGQAQLIARR